eukprot:65571_1
MDAFQVKDNQTPARELSVAVMMFPFMPNRKIVPNDAVHCAFDFQFKNKCVRLAEVEMFPAAAEVSPIKATSPIPEQDQSISTSRSEKDDNFADAEVEMFPAAAEVSPIKATSPIPEQDQSISTSRSEKDDNFADAEVEMFP